MSIFDRIANITKAAVHEALNKLENPVLMTGQYLRNLEEDIHGAEAQLRELRITVKVLERQSDEALRLAEQSEQAALSAISEGDELTAKRAVEAKLRHTEQSEAYAAQRSDAEKRITELEFQLEAAQEELVQLKKKREDLAARAQKVRDQEGMIRPNFSRGIDSGAAARGFERMEEKVTGWEAELEARGHYSGAGYVAHSGRSSEIDAEFSRLQSKLAEAKADSDK
ncbi:phage shock protein A [Paenibacillus sp. CAA11]|uniref:PspA/IM30 family protein n=1 Tax=Paenibacillus sp. CAA11 TaxID=1532905 RepID=UPI000D3AFCBF|nr:PspA/IM30 family protein [Paenibacillus sp. CAA11]AWB43182.1 phage shock protein A [Paenibacillus sp. CAA11]